jgi:hypothetical protein
MFGKSEYVIRSLSYLLPYPLDPWNAIKLAALQHFDVQASFNFVYSIDSTD